MTLETNTLIRGGQACLRTNEQRADPLLVRSDDLIGSFVRALRASELLCSALLSVPSEIGRRCTLLAEVVIAVVVKIGAPELADLRRTGSQSHLIVYVSEQTLLSLPNLVYVALTALAFLPWCLVH